MPSESKASTSQTTGPKDMYMVVNPSGKRVGPTRGTERSAWLSLLRQWVGNYEDRMATAKARGYRVEKINA